MTTSRRAVRAGLLASAALLASLHCLAADEPAGRKVEAGRSATIEADLDCDGKPDRARVSIEKGRLTLRVAYANKARKPERLSFEVSSVVHDGVCAVPAYVQAESLDYELAEIFLEPVPGFFRSKTCQGLVIADGKCDALHFFWNRKRRKMDWWKL